MSVEIITIKEMLEQSTEKYCDQVAFQIKEEGVYRQITFGELAALVRKLQGRLVKLGVEKGARVGLLSENRPEWGISYLAIVGMGAILLYQPPIQPEDQKLVSTLSGWTTATIRYVTFTQDQNVVLHWTDGNVDIARFCDDKNKWIDLEKELCIPEPQPSEDVNK